MKNKLTKHKYVSILANYELGALKDPRVFTQGSVQTNVLLKTSKDRVVLRYYTNRSIKSVAFEVNFINYLNKNKYPCPAPIKNKRGKFIGLLDNNPYVIFEFAAGDHIERPNKSQKNQLIEKVAGLQNVAGNYCPPNKESRWNYGVELCRKLANKEAKKVGTKDAVEKLKWYKSALRKLELPSNLPKGVCHCDFHFSNILFKKGKFEALIDFDDANYTYRTFDLAALINPFVSSYDWNTWQKFKKGENVFDFTDARKTVETYEKYRALNNIEKRYLYDVFKLVILIDCLWYFSRGRANDFFEKRKIEYLDSLGRDKFNQEIFV